MVQTAGNNKPKDRVRLPENSWVTCSYELLISLIFPLGLCYYFTVFSLEKMIMM